MNNVTENQKYLQSVHDDLRAKLFSIFRNDDLIITISVDNLSNEELVRFSDLDDILKTSFFNEAFILDNNFYLTTKSKK